MDIRFLLGNKVVVRGDARLNNEMFFGLFKRFTFEVCEIEFHEGESLTLVIGDVKIPHIPNGCEYSLLVNDNGVAVAGRDYASLMRGYFSMLMKIERKMGTKELFISATCENKSYKIQNRMVHVCVFPETTLLDLKKYVRLFALLQYTHVVIEFWGMLKFECCPPLAWENAFTKSEIKEVVNEAKCLGIEAIPMFNSLGHASQSRYMSGKHTILDNDVSLYHLFTPDGWAWDLENEEVFSLLKNVRSELYEVFEGCKYFHLGFDESHIHNRNKELSSRLPNYMSRLTKEVQNENKRPMIWMDMILPPDAFTNMQGNEHSVKSKNDCLEIIKGLADNTVFVDWEYSVKRSPISSVIYFKDLNIDIMGACWFDIENGKAHIDTVSEHNLFGFMQTTWHTISNHLPNTIEIAKHFGAELPIWSKESQTGTLLATLIRGVTFEKTDYYNCGWVKKQID